MEQILKSVERNSSAYGNGLNIVNWKVHSFCPVSMISALVVKFAIRMLLCLHGGGNKPTET